MTSMQNRIRHMDREIHAVAQPVSTTMTAVPRSSGAHYETGTA